jgi:hypothetical protein
MDDMTSILEITEADRLRVFREDDEASPSWRRSRTRGQSLRGVRTMPRVISI